VVFKIAQKKPDSKNTDQFLVAIMDFEDKCLIFAFRAKVKKNHFMSEIMQRTALISGSFDPPTNGHLDLIETGLKLCDRLVLAIGIHPTKQPLFSFEERVELLRTIVSKHFATRLDAIDIIAFDGLLIDKAREIGAKILIRGLRDGGDFDYEMKLHGTNRALAPEIDTIFIPAHEGVRHITATLVRQIAAMGGDVSVFVPDNIQAALTEKFIVSARDNRQG